MQNIFIFPIYLFILTNIVELKSNLSKFRLAVTILGDWKDVKEYKNLIKLNSCERFELDICWISCTKYEETRIQQKAIDEESDIFIFNNFPKLWEDKENKKYKMVRLLWFFILKISNLIYKFKVSLVKNCLKTVNKYY